MLLDVLFAESFFSFGENDSANVKFDWVATVQWRLSGVPIGKKVIDWNVVRRVCPGLCLIPGAGVCFWIRSHFVKPFAESFSPYNEWRAFM